MIWREVYFAPARGVHNHRGALLSCGRIVHFSVFSKREWLLIISNSWLNSEFSIIE